MKIPEPFIPTQEYEQNMGFVFECFQEVLKKNLHFLVDNQISLLDTSQEKNIKIHIFELGCLNFYLLDHELRKEKQDDPAINNFMFMAAHWLFNHLDNPYSEMERSFIFNWRMGCYHDVSKEIEKPEGVDVRIYFYQLAEQAVRCFIHDMNDPDINGIFPGIVKDNNKIISSEILQNYIYGIQEALFEYSFGFYLAARLWTNDKEPIYAKPIDQLQQTYYFAQREASSLLSSLTKSSQ